jgi:hypothetical protein
LLALQNTWKD